MTAGAAPGPAPPRRPNRRRGEGAEHFRLMADWAPVMIWVAAPDRKCVYLNRPWLEFTGLPLEDQLGTGWADTVHPDDRDRTALAYARAFESREAFELDYRRRRHDGEFRWIHDRGVPLFSDGALAGFVGSCLDITDRMLAEQEARRREAEFKTLAENIPDVIARLDRDLRYAYVNKALGPALGLEPGQLIGRARGESPLPPHVGDPIERAAQAALAGGAEQPFQFASDATGKPRHFEGRAIPERDARGRIEAVLVIAYDVTARVLEDERRAEVLERERSARASAESATLARDQFLAIVSHELRSPLNGIKSWTHVLENHLAHPEPTVRRALAGIMIGVEHQVRLIEDLLDVTRAMGGNLGLVKQPMALLPVLEEAVESLRATALEKDLRIESDYGIGDGEIHGDPDRVRQIFVNLLANAIKFTPAGGTIRVAAVADGAMARIEVHDNGAGIPPEFLPFTFDPFRQADQGSSRRGQQGLGLGLALVQRLAELHGGYANCESDGVDRGSTFRVYLPLHRDSGRREALPRASLQLPSLALPSLAGIRVVLIDDQREARESLAALLTQAGASVASAASGHEALAYMALSDGLKPEVIVCDIAMPGEDGYATLKRIRAWESSGTRARRPRRPAIAVSAFTQREDRMRALAEGFQMHLAKPVAPAELVTVISTVARGMGR